MKTIKSFILIIMLLALATSAECQKLGIPARVKSVVVSEEKFDMIVKKQYKESETYYDSRGNIVESITYKQGKVDKHFKYEYDNENNKIKEEEFDPSGKLKESSDYKYLNGVRTEKNVYDSNKKLKSRKTYTYTTY
jgi:hypothetical protein